MQGSFLRFSRPHCYRAIACSLACSLLAAALPAYGDIHRWDNNAVIAGTGGINPGPGIDLSGWTGVNHNLEYANFINTNLTGSTFANSDLLNANLTFATLSQVNFTGALVAGINFSGTTYSGFTYAQLTSTLSYQNKSLAGVSFSTNNLTGWSFKGQDLSNATFVGALFAYSDLSNADLANTDFTSANLANATFIGADLRGATNFTSTASTVTTNAILPDGTVPTLQLTGTQTLVVNANPIAVTVQTPAQIAAGGSWIINGSSVTVPSISNAGTLTLTGGNLSVASLVSTSNLTITAPAQLNLNKGDLVFHSTPANLDADDAKLAGYLTNSQIYSSAASSSTGLGLMKGSDYLALNGPGAAFEGQPVSSTDLLIKYTYLGDANLDGKITAADYAQIDAGFLLGNFNAATNPAQWVNGDFNGDGVVNYLDYAAIDAGLAAYQGSGTPLAQQEFAQHAALFGEAYVAAYNHDLAAGAPIPEPATLGLLALGAMGLLTRRKNVTRSSCR